MICPKYLAIIGSSNSIAIKHLIILLSFLIGAPMIIKKIDRDNCLDVFMYAKLHKYEDVEKAAFEAISRHVKFILEGTRLKNLIKDHPEEVANLMVNHCACMGTRLKTLIKDHPEEIANLMVNINKNMQQKLDHGGNN